MEGFVGADEEAEEVSSGGGGPLIQKGREGSGISTNAVSTGLEVMIPVILPIKLKLAAGETSTHLCVVCLKSMVI